MLVNSFCSNTTTSHQQPRVAIIGEVDSVNNVASTVANNNDASEDDLHRLTESEFIHFMNFFHHFKSAMPHIEKGIDAMRPTRYRQCVLA